MNLEKFGQNFGQKVKWLKKETKRFFSRKIEQTSRVESRDRHADGDLKLSRGAHNTFILDQIPVS